MHDMRFMADGCGLPKRDLALAARVLDTLDVVGSYSLAHYEEVKRVSNLGIPLAEMIYHGLVARLTDKGRNDLACSADTLAIVAEVSATNPRASIREMWDRVNEIRKERAL